jgi:hypothetical protein
VGFVLCYGYAEAKIANFTIKIADFTRKIAQNVEEESREKTLAKVSKRRKDEKRNRLF